MTLYKIFVRDNINQRFLKIMNEDKQSYLNNLFICKEAQHNLKCNIIFNGVTTDKHDLLEVIWMDRKKLHQIEMDLVYLLEENKLTKEHIIEQFTNLMNEVN